MLNGAKSRGELYELDPRPVRQTCRNWCEDVRYKDVRGNGKAATRGPGAHDRHRQQARPTSNAHAWSIESGGGMDDEAGQPWQQRDFCNRVNHLRASFCDLLLNRNPFDMAMAEDQTRTPKFCLLGFSTLAQAHIGCACRCKEGLRRRGKRRCGRARAAVAAASDVQPGTVVIVQGFSSDISLPEKCDVLVAEIVGSIASEEGIVGTYRDAQRRLLKAPADPRSYIPQRVQTWCAPASHVLTSLLRPPFAAEDFAARQTGQPVRVGCRDAALQLLSSPQLLEDYDFAAMAAQLPSEHGPSPAAPSSTQPTVPSPLPVKHVCATTFRHRRRTSGGC